MPVPLIGASKMLLDASKVVAKIASLGKDLTVNYTPERQRALDSAKGQEVYTGYIDYGLPPEGAAALTVADLYDKGDKFADQKEWRKLVLTSPLLIAQQKGLPIDEWPEGVLTISLNGKRVRKDGQGVKPEDIIPTTMDIVGTVTGGLKGGSNLIFLAVIGIVSLILILLVKR